MKQLFVFLVTALVLSASVTKAQQPQGWVNNMQMELTLTKDVTLTSITVYEPDQTMKGKTFYLYIGDARVGVNTGSVGSSVLATNANYYTIRLTRPITLRKGTVYTVQTRFWGSSFNAGRPTQFTFQQGTLRTFQTYDNGRSHYARF